MWKCLIVDDEPNAALALKNLLQKEKDIEVIGVEHNTEGALECLEKHQPNLLFLDILLGNTTAFELLDQCDEKTFEIIFTTGHSNFAIQAIRAGAFDYLLKPIRTKQLEASLKRLAALPKKTVNQNERYEVASNYLNGICEQIALPETDGCRFVNVQDIVHIRAQRNYCDLHFIDGLKLTVTRQLKVFAEFLEPFGFCRIHHSHAINLRHLVQHSKSDGGKVVMADGVEILVSKLYKENLLDSIASIRKI